jgi:hypothetical protein
MMYLRWLAPGDTWRRLLETPIGALVPPAVVTSVGDALAGIERIELRVDLQSTMPPQQRAEIMRMGARAQLLGPDEQQKWADGLYRDLATGKKNPMMPDPAVVAKIGPFPGYDADLVVVADEAARIRLDALVAGGFGGSIAWRDEGGSRVMDGDHARLTASSDAIGIHLRSRPEWSSDALDRPGTGPAWSTTQDIEMRTVVTPRDPAAYARVLELPEHATIPSGMMSLSIADGRARMRMDAPPTMPKLWRDSMKTSAALTAAAWDRVPAEALVAAAYALEPDDRFGKTFAKAIAMGMLVPLVTGHGDDGTALVDALSTCMANADGVGFLYVEPAGLLPAVTVAVPVGDEAGQTLVSAMQKVMPTATVMPDRRLRIQLGMVMLQIGVRDGLLACTSNPAGLDAIAVRPGVFTAQADVAAGLIAGGEQPALSRIVVRADRILEFVQPLAAAGGVPAERTASLQEASKRFGAEGEAGWLVLRSGSTGMSAEAGGAVALAAGALLLLKDAAPGAVTGIN